MIALILRNDTATAPPMALTLIDMGFQVICVESLGAADAMVRGSQIDVVITDELIGNTLSHNLLLSVERRNPHASAFVLTDKKGTDADELFLLLPSVYALLPVNAPTQMLIRFVNAAMSYDGNAAHVAAETATETTLLDEILDDWVEDDVPVVPELATTTPDIVKPKPEHGGFQSVRTPVMH